MCHAIDPFFYHDPAPAEIYTLSLHDALPIYPASASTLHRFSDAVEVLVRADQEPSARDGGTDRKSTRLNSSHSQSSYAVFCLKKKRSSRSSSDRRQGS